jgi:hypothetical protein
MMALANGRSLLRGLGRAAPMPAAALAVHELRFELAFGGNAGAVLAHEGHSYLNSVAPWLVLLVGVGAGAFLWALGRALAGQRSLHRYTLSLAALWLATSACLVGIYVAQELLEGMLVTGHPPGLEGVVGYGGWWAIPAALCVGFVLATVFHGARWVLDEITERRSTRAAPLLPPRAVSLWRMPVAIVPTRAVALACGWSGRGPPR